MKHKFEDTPEILKSLVHFDSVSSRSVLPIADYLSQQCQSLGFEVKQYHDDLDDKKTNVVCFAGPQKEGGLVISGHMDVVPTEDQPWQTDPFKLTKIDGKYFGRGSADMKGFIACTLTALSRINIQKLKEPLYLIWTYDEEVGCQGSHKLIHALQNSSLILPKEALIGEPTDFKIFRMHPGHVAFKIETQGLAAHSSKPHLGKNAIKSMQIILSVIEQLEKDLQKEIKHPEYFDHPYVTLNIGMIRGGQAVNIVPDKCEIIAGYRPMPGDESMAIFERLRSRLFEVPHLSTNDWNMNLISAVPALYTPKDSPLEKNLLPFASNPTPLAASFATDGGNLAALGINSLIFGPGSIDVAHKANEYIEHVALQKGANMLEKIIQSRELNSAKQ